MFEQSEQLTTNKLSMKKSVFKYVALAVALSTIIVLYGCKEEEELQSSIYGMVTDYATGNPIGNVNVRLRPSGETTLTGSDGAFEFKNLDPGKYSLLLSKAEYADFDDDSIMVLDAGKSMKRDVQMRKLVSSLRITDMSGEIIHSLDFGSDEFVTSKSFNIFNDGTVTISCQMFYNCVWIDTAIAAGTTIAPGQTLAVTVIIDREQLSSGENRTYMHIISNNGNNELLITAIGPGAPTILTNTVSNQTATSAVCGGNVTSDGGSAVTDRGICWATFNAPSLENGSHLSNGTGMGTFSSTMSNLTPNTVYYVRAFATNVRGTAYGEERQFTTNDGMPTVTINAVTNVTATSAVCGGSISNNGGFAVSDKGLVWSTSQYPTMNDYHISLGSGDTPFSGSMTNLLMGTTYYVRTYATNTNGTTYSSIQKTFTTTDGLPTVSTNTVANVATSSAVCGGSISSDGGYPVSDKGLVWGTSQMPTLSSNHISLGSGNAPFSGTMTNLSLSTTYYVRAYATNANGTTYGEQRTFTTTNGLPTVTTIVPTRNNLTVTSGGNVTSDGGYAVTARGICYGTSPYPDLSSSHSHTTNGTGTGTYSSTFTMPGQGIYYVRAYATNSVGTTYGEQYTINHPYNDLPTFTYGGQTYRVAPAASTTMTWSDANSYCNNLTLYGYSDWRLPTQSELSAMFYSLTEMDGTQWASDQCEGFGDAYDYDFCHYAIGGGNVYCWNNNHVTFFRPIRVEN